MSISSSFGISVVVNSCFIEIFSMLFSSIKIIEGGMIWLSVLDVVIVFVVSLVW